ncbi:MAG: tRNA pseudouridine(55) synthase TruB [Pseudomonadales bacterium]|nr:tRNA pseudouridine(55) synthase TruB [Pseudomonadales bacterium]
MPEARKTRVKRPLDGILVLDKPLGLSSNAALQRVKYLLQASKAGHTGSLDPLATGVLPLCFGEATKFAQGLLDSDKSYRVGLRLGQSSTTLDAEGDLGPEQMVPMLDELARERLLEAFRGEQLQVPPMHSALKREGRPLYELARQGIEVERDARPVTIYRLQCLVAERRDWILDVDCSKGTYIRSLVHDIGQALGCGAYVTSLRRLAAGPFREMHTLDAIEACVARGEPDACLQPVDSALAGWTRLELCEQQAYNIRLGKIVDVGKSHQPGQVALYINKVFLGVGEISELGELRSRRLMNTSLPG